jgi:MOSC domain-containing protein YiiM
MSFSSEKGTVRSVCLKEEPGIPKIEMESIQLLKDLGVEGDYHAGKFVRHRYLAKKDPEKENIRQVLMIDCLILSELADQGIVLEPGEMGENIILEGIDLMTLPIGTRLQIGDALLELTEFRDPCKQLNFKHPEVLKSVVKKTDGEVEYNAGVFGKILKGGIVRPGDPVSLIDR